MCFKSKMKVPKATPEMLKAPEPQLLEPPQGVEVGDGADDSDTNDNATKGRDLVTIERDKGDGSTKTVSTDTGISKSKSPAIKRALKR